MSTKITNNHLAKLVLGVPSGSAKHQLGLRMGCSLLDITLRCTWAESLSFMNPLDAHLAHLRRPAVRLFSRITPEATSGP
ncbi:MAG: hypothetical protein ACOYMG_26245, partial [Candidatus Methylumidiphilus sp.]